MKNIINRSSVLVAFIVLAALSRLFPHIDNFTPITAIALFGAAYFTDKRMAFFVPILAMFISDVCFEVTRGVGFHEGTLVVYTAFLLTVVLGIYLLKKVSFTNVVLASLAGSILFYLITNFAFLYPVSMYPRNVSGILASYLMAIPFFRSSLMGDLFYCAVLFGSFSLLQNYVPNLRLAVKKS